MRSAKRARPETLPAAHFLSTRAQQPTEEDADIAYYCLRRLSGSKELGLRLSALDPVAATQCVDAAHGAHQKSYNAEESSIVSRP